MTTSSIFKDFEIKDQETANRLFKIMLEADKNKDKNRKSYEPTGIKTLEGEALEKWLEEHWRN